MKNYKVGDKVWWTTYKILCEVADIKYSENGTPFEWIIDTPGFKGIRFDLFRIKEITQSADSMFEELGYEMFNVDNNIFFRNKTYKIEFDKGFEGYYVDKLVGDIETFINTQLHQAIHQKLIELGWIE